MNFVAGVVLVFYGPLTILRSVNLASLQGSLPVLSAHSFASN